MPTLRRLAYLALALAYLQIVFGAIVRITGSGLGCGPEWPKCRGEWIPPLDRPELIIEVTHRFLALALLVSLFALLTAAWSRREETGIAGRGGVLRAAGLAVALWWAPALLGALSVWLDLHALAVVVHLALAMTLLAVLAVAAMRAGGLGAAAAAPERGSARTARGTAAAAAIAFVVLVLGALTANVSGAAAACQGFPLCSGSVIPRGGAQLLHMSHRVLALLFVFHLLGMVIGMRKRAECRVVTLAARLALGISVAQIVVAAALVESFLPPALQSIHQAIGTLVWLSVFSLAALARMGHGFGIRGAEPEGHAP